ncbi:MAG: alpha/beta fold hydrolase [Agarilytica sp.]
MSIQENPWFQVYSSTSVIESRLFCFPFAGGAATAFSNWHRFLPEGVQVCALKLPGHFGRLSEPCLTNLEVLVQRIFAEITPLLEEYPFYFFGHSMGARVAYELSVSLQTEQLPLPKELFVSAAVAPHLERRKKLIHKVNDTDFMTEVVQINGTPLGVFENAELREISLPILRADFELCETWKNEKRATLPTPLRAFGGLRDPGVNTQELDAWQECTESEFKRHLFPGDHFYQLENEQKLLSLLSRYILLSE